MGMSTYVVGIKPADEKYRKMEQVYRTCKELGIPAPKEVYDYFDGDAPNGVGVEVGISYVGGGDEGRLFYDVHVDSLPKDVKIIRFVNSW